MNILCKYLLCKRVKLAILLVALVFLVFCGKLSVSGTSGSETGNGRISGCIVDRFGKPSPHTRVALLANDYNPIQDILSFSADTTDSLGNYTFFNAKVEKYSLQAINLDNGRRLLIRGSYHEGDTIIVPTDTLRETGTLKLMLPTGFASEGMYVYVPGTTNFAFLNTQSTFVTLDSIPVGVIPDVSYSSTSRAYSTVIRNFVTVSSGDTTVIFNILWKNARPIFLNTTASGAAVTKNEIGFPVLIRLTNDNFDFSQVQKDGGDIRFTKSDGTPLPYEIERFDPVAQRAEVWVRVDTVYGNDSSQYIQMYWGTSTGSVTQAGATLSPSLSNSNLVFDTANGFWGVWHLSGNCLDVSTKHFDGISYGTVNTEGVIGGAKRFTGKDSIVVAGLFDSLQTISLSAWVNIDSAGTSGGDVISIGDAVLIRVDEKTSGVMGSMRRADTVFLVVGSGQQYAKTGWHFVTFTCDGAAHVQTISIDGVVVKTETYTDSIVYGGAGKNTLFGAHGMGKTTLNYKGYLDEIRVYNRAVSVDWIKLCYMNQKFNDKLVVFRRYI